MVYIAKGYSGYGLPVEDLIQQGNVGLMKSVKKFDLQHEFGWFLLLCIGSRQKFMTIFLRIGK